MEHECDSLQGFLFSRPVPASQRAAAAAQSAEAIQALQEPAPAISTGPVSTSGLHVRCRPGRHIRSCLARRGLPGVRVCP